MEIPLTATDKKSLVYPTRTTKSSFLKFLLLTHSADVRIMSSWISTPPHRKDPGPSTVSEITEKKKLLLSVGARVGAGVGFGAGAGVGQDLGLVADRAQMVLSMKPVKLEMRVYTNDLSALAQPPRDASPNTRSRPLGPPPGVIKGDPMSPSGQGPRATLVTPAQNWLP